MRPDWIFVSEYLTRAIEAARDRLEGTLDHDETTRMRGALLAYREILRLPETTVVNQDDR